MSDLRSSDIKKKILNEEQNVEAEELLDNVVKKQKLDEISNFSTYEIIAIDQWKGLMGKMANPWGWEEDTMSLRFSVGDFDGQVSALTGEKKGFVAGIQSWDYYEKVDGSYQTDVEDDESKIFNLAAIHYFFELANRLSDAPLVRYIGESEFNGKAVTKIFVSWGDERTKDYDQYVLWISKDSGLIEVVEFTTREAPSPAPSFLYGSLILDDYRDVSGVLIPFKLTIQLNKPKEKESKFIHQLNIESFEWDSFPISDIRPFSNLPAVGDDKPYQN